MAGYEKTRRVSKAMLLQMVLWYVVAALMLGWILYN